MAVLSAGAFAAAAEAAPRRFAAAAPRALTGSLEHGGMAEWRILVGQRFRVASASPLRLVAVEPVTSGGPRPGAVRRRRGFAAVFEASGGNPPEGDATYWLAHGARAAMPVYLGPRATISGKTRLVAIFN